MIQRSDDFDLGQDKTRIKDQRDADRQHATVDVILQRYFDSRPGGRSEIQILADEVGMGKTFVALGVTYSVLQNLRNGSVEPDLEGCCKKVVIVTPVNSALFNKWQREVSEFVKRCVKPERQADAARWFSATQVERLDDLVCAVSKPGAGPRIVVTTTAAFGGGRFRNYDLKRRFLLGILFRHWGTRFRGVSRKRLLKGAPDGWPSNPKRMEDFTDEEWAALPFAPLDVRKAIRRLSMRSDLIDKLLETCQEIAKPHARDRETKFQQVEQQLIRVYRELLPLMLRKPFPLVVVDEAHNWKNGPLKGANGYDGFVKALACRSRRVLLMTATPFQLRPDEMLEILKISDHLKICPDREKTGERRNRLERLREKVIRPVLKNSAHASKSFTQAWARLPVTVTRSQLAQVWSSDSMIVVRRELQSLAAAPEALSDGQIAPLIHRETVSLDPDVRELIRDALQLYAHNVDLSRELGSLVIRHRRKTDHRRFRVGAEFDPMHDGLCRNDRHVLHLAPGLDVSGPGELPHYLLMRCVSEMKNGKGRSSLGSNLTGCYSTLLHSSEGRSIQKHIRALPAGGVYFRLLLKMLGKRHDKEHPKVQEVVQAAIRSWHNGEKFLVFCFRTNTAERLREIIDRRIRGELAKRRQRCLGSPESLKSLRSRLTGRDRDLVVLGLDRVLWSFFWARHRFAAGECSLTVEQLRLTDTDLREMATLALKCGIDLTGERVDRVFVNRATEHIVACRLLENSKPTGLWKQLLRAMADLEWVRGPYGLMPEDQGAETEGGEQTQFDERGVHSRYERTREPTVGAIDTLAQELTERRHRAKRQGQVSVLDVYAEGPSLWLGAAPSQDQDRTEAVEADPMTAVIRQVHEHLFDLTYQEGDFDWEGRRMVFQALRRAVLRESVLLRLLPDSTDRGDEAGWGELLVRRFYQPMSGQREGMADKIGVFLEDLLAASGSLHREDSARYALYQATQLRDQQAVALVKGDTDDEVRERVFAGFNTPLLPEILICTSVGQEGIDLHRHCRHVVHYDLAWNPAVLEQRTGRVDRIGSKTFRERALEAGPKGPFLEIGVPFLAGTYDERMYEELRLRSQTFEVLTGGRLLADAPEGHDDEKRAEGRETGLHFVALPEEMVDDLRVKLHVWSEKQ